MCMCYVSLLLYSSLLLNAPGMFIIITLCSFTGLVMYAYYVDCDPLAAGIVDDPNQVTMPTLKYLYILFLRPIHFINHMLRNGDVKLF